MVIEVNIAVYGLLCSWRKSFTVLKRFVCVSLRSRQRSVFGSNLQQRRLPVEEVKWSNELNFCINRAKKNFRIKDPSASALMVFKPWVSGVNEWVSGVPLFMQQFISIHLHDNGATGDCRCTCDWCCGIVAVQQKGPDWLQKQIMRKGPRLESRKMSFISCEGKKTKMQPDELSGRRS